MARRFNTPSNDPRSQVGRRAPESKRSSELLAYVAKLRSSSRWRKCRDSFIARHPLCCDPLCRHDGPEPAVEAHHIKGLAKAPHLLCVESNLAPLCEQCHHSIEAMERAGINTVNKFKNT